MTFTFMERPHEISLEEIAAVERTGRSDWYDYARKSDAQVARPLDTFGLMDQRPGATEHGTMPIEPRPVDRAKVMHQVLIHLEGYSCSGTIKQFKSKDEDFHTLLRINPRAACRICTKKFREINPLLS